MTTTPTSHSDAVAMANAARREILDATTRFYDALARMQSSIDRLNRIGQQPPNGYAALVAYANDQQAANPGVPLWEHLKSETDQIVTDYQARLAELQAILDAANGAQ